MTVTKLDGFETADQWQEVLTGQFLLFSLVGRLLYNPPAATEIVPLVEEDIFAETPYASGQPDVSAGLRLLQQWSREFQTYPEEKLGDIQGDYTRLFTGMASLPIAPWESVYYTEERRVFAESTLDVRGAYRQFGLEVAKLHQEPDDHIGLELLFVGHLSQLALQAAATGNTEEAQRILDAQRTFARRHLLRWAFLWCDQMLEFARTGYYRGLALLVRGALAELRAHLHLDKVEVAA